MVVSLNSRLESNREEEKNTESQVRYSSPGRGRVVPAALNATQGQNDRFFSQLPYKCHFKEVALT